MSPAGFEPRSMGEDSLESFERTSDDSLCSTDSVESCSSSALSAAGGTVAFIGPSQPS